MSQTFINGIRVIGFTICLALAPMARGDQFDNLRTYWQNYLIAGGGRFTGSPFGGSPTELADQASRDWNSMNTNANRSNLFSFRGFGRNRSFGTNRLASTNRPFGSNNASGTITRNFMTLETMALAWATPGCSLRGNTNLAAAVNGGMDWMVANIYTPTGKEYDNWWDWEIGGPQAFMDAVVLMYPTLTSAQISNYCAAIDGHSPGGAANSYGWQWSTAIADLGIVMVMRGVLGKDTERMVNAQTNLAAIFPDVKTGNGFYDDGSFVLHSNKAYTGAYGLILLDVTADLINLLDGSPWQFTQANKDRVFKWVTNSFEPVVYHGVMMDMVRGRTISRPGETENISGLRTIAAVQQIARFAPPATAAALSNWASAPHIGPGQYQFAGMDRVVARRDDFALGISMCSARIANYESIHYENLRGWFIGEGMTYLYLGPVDTQFTDDFWPTVDAYHLPGTTVEMIDRKASEGCGKTTSQRWVGGAQVSRTYGAAGMSLADPLSPALTAKKSWFMFDNEVVCLGAGITCADKAEIDTTVEDRRLGTSPTNKLTVNGTEFAPVMGWSNTLGNVSWCALDGVGGYYFPGGAANLQGAFVANEGGWGDISGRRRGFFSSTSDDYLKLWYNHGAAPTNATYSYVLLPNMTAANVAAYASHPDIVVLANTPEVQAAKKPSLGVVGANFWTGGKHSVDLIAADQPSSIVTSRTTRGFAVGMSDPTQTNQSVMTVTLKQAARSLVSADAGVKVKRLSPEIVLTVDLSGSLGKSFQASFKL